MRTQWQRVNVTLQWHTLLAAEWESKQRFQKEQDDGEEVSHKYALKIRPSVMILILTMPSFCISAAWFEAAAVTRAHCANMGSPAETPVNQSGVCRLIIPQEKNVALRPLKI